MSRVKIMGNHEEVKALINAKIKTNGSQSITGAVLNEVLNEMVDELDVTSEINNKVDKELGKGLSTNDFTTSEKEKLAELQNYDDAELRGEVESLQTEVDSHDVAIEDLQDNKVDKGDYAPALTAGFADNLVSKDVVVDSEFNLRRSGGGAISDGVARMEVVKGNSVVWNQKLRPLLSTEWYINPNYASSEYSGNYCKLTVAQEASALPVNGVAIIATTTNQKPALPKHAYLITAEIKVSVAISVGIRNFTSPWGGDYKKDAQANQWTRVAFIDKPTELYNGYTIVGTTTNIGLSVGDTIEIRNVAVVDLTQMFGAGNEPTTIEEFYARKPMGIDEYAYNEGEVIHNATDKIESVGVNQWDEEWELGEILSNGTPISSQTAIRSKNFNPIIEGQTYNFHAIDARILIYDKNYTFIDFWSNGASGDRAFLTPQGSSYFKISSSSNYGGVYKGDICFNLSDPSVNGKYFPYVKREQSLDIIRKYFPNGMKSAGTAHDEIRYNKTTQKWEAVKRIGEVDMGTLSWAKSGIYTNGYFALPLSGAKPLQYPLCRLYSAVNVSSQQDKSI